jgi:hypothetical protein
MGIGPTHFDRNGDDVRSPTTWFLVLAGICVAGPYVLGVRPKTPQQWRYATPGSRKFVRGFRTKRRRDTTMEFLPR